MSNPDSTGLVRDYNRTDGHVLHASLDGITVPLVPAWVQRLTNAPGGLRYASLGKGLMEALEIPEETYRPAQEYVRDYGSNLIHATGSILLIAGPADPWSRRILAAGTVNEIIRVYYQRADVTSRWFSARSLEALHLGFNREKIATLYNDFTCTKLVTIDGLNMAMRDSRDSTEEVLFDRLTGKLPTVLVMNESPLFSPELADELSGKHHYRAFFPSPT